VRSSATFALFLSTLAAIAGAVRPCDASALRRAYFRAATPEARQRIAPFVARELRGGIVSAAIPPAMLETFSSTPGLRFLGYEALYHAAPIATLVPRADAARPGIAAGAERPCTLPSWIPPVGWGIRTMYDDPNLLHPSGGAGVKVGVIDTGVYPHLDIVRRLVKCMDLTPNGILPPCADSMNHGTMVASVIAADGGADGLGMWGMAPEASIYSYRVCEPNTECWGAYLVDGIYAAIADGVNIINMSLDGPGNDEAVRAAIDDAVAHNILVVVAAGNSPPYSYVGYPASYPEVVSVGAIRENLDPWPYTASGVNDPDYVREDNEIELAAPGAAVLAAMKTGCWVLGSGTSLAAPLVTGLAARLWNGDAAATRARLQRAARFRDLFVAGNDTLTGFGLPTIRDYSDRFVINASAGPGGSLSPGGGIAVSPGATQGFTIVASDDCHVLQDVEVDGVPQGPVSGYTFGDVHADHVLRATFAPLGPYTITASAGPAGTISPSGATIVACGGRQTYTITPPAGCGAVEDVLVDGVSQGAIASYSFSDVRSPHTIEARISATSTHTITTSVLGPGGSISPAGVVNVTCGSTQTFTFMPTSSCYVVDVLVVDGAVTGPRASYTFTNVRSDHTLAVAFTYAFTSTITASGNLGGTITPRGPVTVPCGQDQTYTILPTPNCGMVERVKIDAVWQGPLTSYTFKKVRGDHTIQAVFSGGTQTITTSAGAGGRISPSGASTVGNGAAWTCFIAPADACHRIQDVQVDGVSQGPVSSYTFTNLSGGHTIEAAFSTWAYTITASAGPGAAVIPSGPITVPCGGSQSYAIVPAEACRVIDGVEVDGAAVGVVAGYTFRDIAGPHTISASSAPSGLTLTETHTGASIGGIADGAIDVTVAGGVPPYAYAWSNGATGEDVAALAAGAYQVKVTDAQGCEGRLDVTIDNLGPKEVTLSRPAPNPTSGALRLRYGVPAQTAVHLSVLDLQGREVAVLAQGTQPPGWSWASWNGETRSGRAPGGVYFIRLRAGSRQIVQRFALVR